MGSTDRKEAGFTVGPKKRNGPETCSDTCLALFSLKKKDICLNKKTTYVWVWPAWVLVTIGHRSCSEVADAALFVGFIS